MQEELEEVREILGSYASDKQIESLNWPVEAHPSWDAIDDLHGKITWVHQMLELFVTNNQITQEGGEPGSTSTPEPTPPIDCADFIKSFPDAWGCGASFVFQENAGAFLSELDSTDCGRSDDSGHRIYYSNSGSEFAGWGLQWNSSPPS